MKIRRQKAHEGAGDSKPPEPVSPTITRCTHCGEEVADAATRCVYCGANLSDPLATKTAPRPTEHRGSFTEDTPGDFIRGTPNV